MTRVPERRRSRAKKLKQTVLAPYSFLLQYRRARRFQGAVYLNTMRKSGTHYLMLLLANYLSAKYLGRDDRMGIEEARETIWARDGLSQEQREICQHTGISRFFFGHDYKYLRFNNSRHVVHLKRNPFDSVVSNYYYEVADRDIPFYGVSNISEYIDVFMPRFVAHSRAISRVKPAERLLELTYEDLIAQPARELSRVLARLDVQIEGRLVEFAVEAADKRHVKEEEQRAGRNLVSEHVKRSFIRSGEVGEWKDVLTPADCDRIARHMRRGGISYPGYVD